MLGWVRTRKPDVIGLLSLFFLGVSIVVALLTDDPLVVLLRPSVTGAALGLVCFGSLRMRRPLMFYLARPFVARMSTDGMDGFDQLWKRDEFRRRIRTLTVVWGFWLIGLAAARTVAVLNLPIATFLGTWPIVANAGSIGMAAWSIGYGRRAIPALRSVPQDGES